MNTSKKFSSLLFGTAGIPLSTQPRNTLNGIAQVRNLGLDAMELEFVQSVNIGEILAKEVRSAAEKNNVVLTCHGQYYVNLAAIEKAKQDASVQKMVEAARIVGLCGGWSITWHMAFYLAREKPIVHEIVKEQAKKIVKQLQDQDCSVWIRPETTGKETQWGDLKECVKLSQEVEQVLPCIDFGHLHARYNGTNNSREEWTQMLAFVEKELGRVCLDNMHIQVAGVNYGLKGEKNHLNLEESDLNWKDLLSVWKDFKLKGVVIAESPNIEKDSLLLKIVYNQ